jgi:hypothetical protein
MWAGTKTVDRNAAVVRIVYENISNLDDSLLVVIKTPCGTDVVVTMLFVWLAV